MLKMKLGDDALPKMDDEAAERAAPPNGLLPKMFLFSESCFGVPPKPENNPPAEPKIFEADVVAG